MQTLKERLQLFLKYKYPNGYKLQSTCYPLYVWLSYVTKEIKAANLTAWAINLIENQHCFTKSEYSSWEEMFDEAQIAFK